MQDIKYKVVVKTTHKHSDRMDNCANTWLKDIDYVCITDKLTGKYNELSMSDDDEYTSNEEKTVNFINLVRTTTQFDEYDWLVFIDDDAILNRLKFEYIAPKLDKNHPYGLIIASYTEEPNLKYLSGGCGYFISPQLIKQCNEITVKGCGYEDVSMGKWYKENNIKLRETYIDDNQEHYIKLNGWFPLQNEYDKVNDGKTGPEYVLKLIDKIKHNNKINEHLRTHCTHHYIKHLPLMQYIYDRFNEWTPNDL